MFNFLIILSGKLLSIFFRLLNIGNGSTWPGHIALKLNKDFIKQLLKNSNTKTIIVAGTNGKTTTSKLIAAIFEKQGKTVIHNQSGANLLNGIASAIILASSLSKKLQKDYAIFEVDENALPSVLEEITPDYIILLNLFRDQLDRYGEINSIAYKWQKALDKTDHKTKLILNADDPAVSYLGFNKTLKKYSNSEYFSCNDISIHGNKNPQHAADSVYCPRCGNKLTYKTVSFSHLGDWSCRHCGLKRPAKLFTTAPYYPLTGIYNIYNTNAAVLLAEKEKIKNEIIKNALSDFTPAFGRQEILHVQGKQIKIFLSKNPTGFNESLRTCKQQGAEHLLFVLNDRIPDGTDISWIWDTDIEGILDFGECITISGTRCYDMGLRIKYAIPSKFKIQNLNFKIEDNLNNAVYTALEKVKNNDTLFVLPTYTAMLEVRKILTGKKIL